MKKTLIALAAVAATGAAFAQSSVSLSGSYVGGYESTSKGYATLAKKEANSTTGGVVTDTAAVKMTAVEDLGGGLKASAVVSVGGLARNEATGGEDAYATLSGGFGTFKVGSIENPNDLTPAWIAPGAYGLDGKVYVDNVKLDVAGWTSADMNGFKLSASWTDYNSGTLDPVTGKLTTSAQAGNGGAIGSVSNQPAANFGVSYSNGPLTAAGAFSNYTKRDVAVAGGNSSTDQATTKVKASAIYDLGVAKLAAAFYKKSFETSSAESGYSFGVAVPVAANVSVGGQYGKKNAAGDVSVGKDMTGFSLGAQYDLSKRTNLSTSYASWKAKGDEQASTAFRVFLGHAF